MSDDEYAAPPPPKGGKKAKKKKKRDMEDDEELEKEMRELQLEHEGKEGGKEAEEEPKAPPKELKAYNPLEDDDDDDDYYDKKKRKGKKGGKAKKEEEEVKEDEDEGGDDEEEGGTVKTAAQKKKEKKERQKQEMAKKKAQQAAQAKAKKAEKKEAKKEEETPAETKEETPEPAVKEETPEPKKEEEAEGEDKEEEEKGGKKKKKKKKGEEEPKKKVKGPGKATLAAMQEALKKVQEEEERMRKEAEEKAQREEEAEAARLEKKRLDEGKKAAKKLREKEKREQLRKEGKLLTAKQKLEKQRAEAMIQAMRAQGADVPMPGEKRGPRPGTRVRNKKKEPTPKPEEEEEAPVEEKEEESKSEEPKSEDVTEDKSDAVKDDWDASDSEDDVKDSWEMVEDEKEEEKKAKKKEEVSKESDDESEEESDDVDESEEDSEEEESSEEEAEDRRERVQTRIAKRKHKNEEARSVDVLRSPVVCVLGHVDTGKTKILDKLRRTNVQDGEAGGITQQIGATNVPIEVIKEQCKMVKEFPELKLPGLLIIDTPGHESFSNLRDRGSSLCDIAILVVDIMHCLEPQTIESINLLKKKKTPFVIALNKIDRLYEWKANRHKDVQDVINGQNQNTKLEFNKRAKEVIVGMAEQGLNAALFYENPDPKTYISMVPTSAHSGDGMGNLMGLIVSLSQTMLAKRLAYSEELQATVLEVKAIPGLGTTIDICLVNGTLKEGQTMVLAGTEGPIVTPIKALLTPAKMQDLRVKSAFAEHKEIRAAIGVKIAAKELEKAIAGLNLLVAQNQDEIEILKEEAERQHQSALNAIKLKERGVFVQASTLGSLEALVEFLKQSKIPYAGVKIGPVVKRDVMKASVMLEHEEKYTLILAFDVKVERDAQEMADSMGVKIFQADIIYHLFDRFTEYQEELLKRKREEFKHLAVFPCKLRMLPNFIFNSRDPIVAGVIVEAGIVRVGTPVCVPSKEFLAIGLIGSIECNHKEVETARKGEEVCIKIDPIPGDSPKMFGRHFDETDIIVSKISRATIDVCKQYFRDDLQKSDWQLMVELKKTFEIL